MIDRRSLLFGAVAAPVVAELPCYLEMAHDRGLPGVWSAAAISMDTVFASALFTVYNSETMKLLRSPDGLWRWRADDCGELNES